jgi:hypothetical protein
MTEEEAKTKWCPQAGLEKMLHLKIMFDLVTADPGNPHNIDALEEVKDNTHQKCIASGCMMWVVDNKKGGGLREDRGHCGLSK